MNKPLLIHYVKTNMSEYFVFQFEPETSECDIAIFRKTLFGVVKYRILEKTLNKLNWKMVNGDTYATFLRDCIDSLNDYIEHKTEYIQPLSLNSLKLKSA